MNIKLLFGVLAGITSILCFIPYFQDIFKKKTTPHSYSWLIWSILQTIGVVAIIFSHGGWYGGIGIGIGAFLCLCVFFLSLRFGTKNITKSDTFSLVTALVAILLLIITKNALYSVLLISLIDFIGFVPTYRKGYEEPRSETVSTYFLAAISNICALLALSIYSFNTATYLATLVLSNGLFVIILLYRRSRVQVVR